LFHEVTWIGSAQAQENCVNQNRIQIGSVQGHQFTGKDKVFRNPETEKSSLAGVLRSGKVGAKANGRTIGDQRAGK
jgi:hypothetical protein